MSAQRAALRRIAKTISDATAAALAAEAVAAQVDMQEAVPVRRRSGKIAGRSPGFLRKSIGRRQKSNGDVVVGVLDPRAFYGRFLEHGSSRQRRRPFVRPAWQASTDRFPRRVHEHLKRAMR